MAKDKPGTEYVDPSEILSRVEPGDTVEFNRGNKRLSGRAWPAGIPPRLLVELPRGAVELSSLDPERDLVTVHKRQPPRKNAKPKRLLRADGLNDFRPGLDRVVRFMGRTFVIPVDASYAAVEVDEPPVEVFREAMPKALAAMASRGGANVMFQAVQRSPFLSAEGRRERLDALLATGKVTFVFEVRAG